MIEKHRTIIENLHKTYVAKNADYGNSFGETFQELGPISAVTRISDKYKRMVQLTLNGNQQVKDEALEDTLLDLANYAIMYYMELMEDEDEVEHEVNDYLLRFINRLSVEDYNDVPLYELFEDFNLVAEFEGEPRVKIDEFVDTITRFLPTTIEDNIIKLKTYKQYSADTLTSGGKPVSEIVYMSALGLDKDQVDMVR